MRLPCFLSLFCMKDRGVCQRFAHLINIRLYFLAYGFAVSSTFGIKLRLHLFDRHTINGSCHWGLGRNKDRAASQYRETCYHKAMLASLKPLFGGCFFFSKCHSVGFEGFNLAAKLIQIFEISLI